MEVSPFRYQGPLRPHEVRGRDALLADLVQRVTERRVTALLGPRRFGKTSVLGRLAADLTEVSTLVFDLFGVQTHADLVVRLVAGMRETVPSLRERAHELSVAAGIDLAGVSAQLQLSPRQRPDARVVYAEVVRMLPELAARQPLLVVFDEFQSIVGIDGATAVLRAELQHHYDELSLIFAGSAPSAMRDIFSRSDSPFFNQADLVMIQPLEPSAVTQIINDGFTSTDRRPGGVAGLIFALTEGHPQRTMRAADAVWRQTPPRRVADEHWAEGLRSLRESEETAIAATFAQLSGDEKKVVRVFSGGGAIFGAAGERLGLSAGGGAHARDRLIADGTLRKLDDGRIVVTDPLMADWARLTLPP